MEDLTTRKVLSVISHASIFLSSTVVSIAIPIIVLLVSNDPVVQQNAKEAINFHVNLYIYGAIALLLLFTVVGIPAAIVLGILLLIISFIMPIVAMVFAASNPDRAYYYPFIWHLF